MSKFRIHYSGRCDIEAVDEKSARKKFLESKRVTRGEWELVIEKCTAFCIDFVEKSGYDDDDYEDNEYRCRAY